MPIRIALAAAAVLTFACRAEASEAADLCRGDAFQFCIDELPVRERITACLEHRRAELRPGCQTMFAPTEIPPAVRTAGQ